MLCNKTDRSHDRRVCGEMSHKLTLDHTTRHELATLQMEFLELCLVLLTEEYNNSVDSLKLFTLENRISSFLDTSNEMFCGGFPCFQTEKRRNRQKQA